MRLSCAGVTVFSRGRSVACLQLCVEYSHNAGSTTQHSVFSTCSVQCTNCGFFSLEWLCHFQNRIPMQIRFNFLSRLTCSMTVLNVNF